MQLEEKTISTRHIFEGKIIDVWVDQVQLPDGREGSREIVKHEGAVGILAMDEENNVWMVRQYRKPVERVLLEIPAGTLYHQEDPLECARRELREETGFSAKKWDKILSYFSAPGFCNEALHLFIATDLVAGETSLDGDEFLEAVKVPLPQAYELIFQGQIVDGKSIIAIQHAILKQMRGSIATG